jgi:hypothetical protein
VIGMRAGLLGSLAVSPVNSFLSRFISEEQRRMEMGVWEGSPHEVAGSKIAKKLGVEEPSERAKTLSRVAFATAYGVGWGIIYAMVRRGVPPPSDLRACRLEPPFFLLCDGALAPLFASHRLCGEFLGSRTQRSCSIT